MPIISSRLLGGTYMKKINYLLLTTLAGALVLAGCNSEEKKKPDPTLSSIDVTTMPNKTTYEVGEDFDETGMVVTAYYSNNTHKDLERNDYSIRGFNSSVVNPELQLTVTHKDKFTTFTVSVVATSIKYSISYTPIVGMVPTSDALDETSSSLPTNLEAGESVTIHVVASEGYSYLGFNLASYDYPSSFLDQFESYNFDEDTITITMPDFNIGFKFYFVEGQIIPSHTITYTSYLLNDEGQATDKGNLLFALSSVLPESAQEDDSVSVKFVPTSEYVFQYFSVPESYPADFKEQFNTSSSQFSFEMSTFNVHFDVYFKQIEKEKYTVYFDDTVENMKQFRIGYGYPTEFAVGDAVVFYAAPADGYKLSGDPFDLNDRGLVISKSLIGNTSYTFEMPSHDVLLSVNVIPDAQTYSITYTPYVDAVEDQNSINSGSSFLPTNLIEGASVNVLIVPADGYSFLSFTLDSYDYPSEFLDQFNDYEFTETSFSFTMPAYDIGFDFYLEKLPEEKHSVTFTPSSNLEFVPQSSITDVLEGSAVSFTISFTEGYELDDFPSASDGETVISCSAGVYSFLMPSHDVTISATAKESGGDQPIMFYGSYSFDRPNAFSNPNYYDRYTITFNNDDCTGTYKRENHNANPTTYTLNIEYSISNNRITVTNKGGAEQGTDNTSFYNGFRLFDEGTVNSSGIIISNTAVSFDLFIKNGGTGLYQVSDNYQFTR